MYITQIVNNERHETYIYSDMPYQKIHMFKHAAAKTSICQNHLLNIKFMKYLP